MSHDLVTQAFQSFLDPKGVRKYCVLVTRFSDSDRTLAVSVKLPKGEEFCCGEPGCHVSLFRREEFERLRRHFRAVGIEPGRPLTVRLAWTVEEGSILRCNQAFGPNLEQPVRYSVEQVFVEPDPA